MAGTEGRKRRRDSNMLPQGMKALTTVSPKLAATTSSFAPICLLQASDPAIHTLILGTHPSVKSLASGSEAFSEREIRLRGGDGQQNYGNIHNCFWSIMGTGCGFRRDQLPYLHQKQALTARGFAVWDVVGKCRRKGSLDSDIKSAVANDIPGLLAEHPTITRLVFAATAANFFRKKEHFRSWLGNGDAGYMPPGPDPRQPARTTDWVIRDSSPATTDTVKTFGKCKAVRLIPSADVDAAIAASGLGKTPKRAKKTNPFRKQGGGGGHRTVELVVLPSTSPAAAMVRPAVKELRWMRGCFGMRSPPPGYICPACVCGPGGANTGRSDAGLAHFLAECAGYERWRDDRKARNKLVAKGKAEDDGFGWLF